MTKGRFTRPMESAVRKQIDQILNNLGWRTEETYPDCNVFTERAKTKEQDDRLKGNDPDYVLYRSGTDEPIAVIEAKRPGQDVDQTVGEAERKYANPLGVNILFVYDGAFFKSWHVGAKHELSIDGTAVTQLLPEHQLLRFVAEGPSISELTAVRHSRNELIGIFKWANDLLRKEGLREGIERFTEFANLLFLKLISEMEADRAKRGEPRILEDKYCWGSFANLAPEQMMAYINGVVLPHLVSEYNHSGEVFQSNLSIRNSRTLALIVAKLSAMNLTGTGTDVKGDAFEYFLRDSVIVGNDLGEYFTPRHIVNLMIAIVEPKLTEKVYDPACGTAGFLISAFDYIKKRNAPTAEVLKMLRDSTVYGRELTNTARIAKMNMILTGDGHANIRQMDSLESPVKDEYDVVLSNIPYGQRTDFGGFYPIPSSNADSIFVQHIYKSLQDSPNSRAAVVIPEGLLFRIDMAPLRKFLLEKTRILGIISLPRGVFRPYVVHNKTDILIFAKDPKGTKSVWFYDMKADGFDLNSDSRKPVHENDIPDLLSKWSERMSSEKSWVVSVETIVANNYWLIAKEYDPKRRDLESSYPVVPLSSVAREAKRTITINDKTEYARVTVRLHGGGLVLRDRVRGRDLKTKEQKVARADQLLFAEIDSKLGGYGIVPKELDGAIVSSHYFLFDIDPSKARPKYLDYILRYGPYETLIRPFVKGTTNYADVRPKDILTLPIPLPDLTEQGKIVTEIERQVQLGEDAARTLRQMEDVGIDTRVLAGEGATCTLPEIARIEPNYPLTERSSEFFVGMADLDALSGTMRFAKKAGTTSTLSRFRDDDILFARITPCTENGKVAVCQGLGDETGIGSTEFIVISPDKAKVRPRWLYFYLLTRQVRDKAVESMVGTTGRKRVPAEFFERLDVPLLPLDVQDAQIAELEGFIQARMGLTKAVELSDRAAHRIVETICNVEARETTETRPKGTTLNHYSD